MNVGVYLLRLVKRMQRETAFANCLVLNEVNCFLVVVFPAALDFGVVLHSRDAKMQLD